jgi:hypothetical protein
VAHMRIHRNTQDLEWFGPLERNALYPLFCIALVRSWSTELEEASVCVCVLHEKGLSCSRVQQAGGSMCSGEMGTLRVEELCSNEL